MTLMTLSHGWAIAVSCYRLGPDGQIHCTRAIDPNGFSAAAAAAVTGNGQVARPPAHYGLDPEGICNYIRFVDLRQSTLLLFGWGVKLVGKNCYSGPKENPKMISVSNSDKAPSQTELNLVTQQLIEGQGLLCPSPFTGPWTLRCMSRWTIRSEIHSV
ncbi:hypothetical protein TNCV_2324941 [Trichonephila clavipes]|nr:hypothetical protein TNCV_2324941 [Trichonephila clavipes]